MSGSYRHLKKGIRCDYKWYGNEYGGFYVCPVFINENSIVYSFGIGEDISFDKALIDIHGCHVFGFDPTPKSIDWIKSQKLPENFNFYEYGLGDMFVDIEHATKATDDAIWLYNYERPHLSLGKSKPAEIYFGK